MMESILKDLNESQREAVTTTEGYVRVIAGAGSGKTKALTSRYIYLVEELGVSTSNILSVTFTNKAAQEMKKRIRRVIGDNDTGMICTFHGLCRQILREDINVLNYPDNFIIIDMDDVDSILKIVYEQGRISSRSFTFSQAKEIIANKKSNMNYIKYILDMNSNNIKEKFIKSSKIEDRIFFGYLYQQRKNFNLDFNDLIMFTLYILKNYKAKREKWQKKMQYIMVDEFQDVSSRQYEIATILSGYHKNLFVVGDPDQTIYSWRGAQIDYILNFDKQFPNVKTIIMNINYRSTENILNASNSLIAKNKNRIKKELKATKKSDTPVLYNHCKNTYDEARWISNQIKEIVDSGGKYNDICILYRAHYVSRSIEEIFIKEKIPYVLYSGVEFYQRKEIKDVLSYLRMIVFEDDLSFIRVINEPKRNFGKKRMEIVQNYAEQHSCSLFNALKSNIEDNLISKSKAYEFIDLIEKYKKIYKEMTISDLVIEILNYSGYEAMLRESGEDERLNNLAELKDSIINYENSAGEKTYLEDYLQEITLYTNHDLKEKKDKVKMMTIHTAKGLEFPYVFISNLNEGIFPSKRVDTKEKLEEERRLAYVAYTRAEKALFLSESEGINYDGSPRLPSRFIFNTDKMYLKYCVELDENLIEDTKEFILFSKNKLEGMNRIEFKIGDYVEHNVLGKGIIENIDMDISCYVIRFDGIETCRNISFTTKLTKLEECTNEMLKKNNETDKLVVKLEEKTNIAKELEDCKKELTEEKLKRNTIQEEFKKIREENEKKEQLMAEEIRRQKEEIQKLREYQEKLKEVNSKVTEEKIRAEKKLEEQENKKILKEKKLSTYAEIQEKFKKIREENEKKEKLMEEEIKRQKEEIYKLKEYRKKLKEENSKINEEKVKIEKELEEEKEKGELIENQLKIEKKQIKGLELEYDIKIQEQIIYKNRFSIFGEKSKAKKIAKEKINLLQKKIEEL